MKGRRLLVLSALAVAIGCEDQKLPTAPAPMGPSAPKDPSAIISDGAHCSTPGIACNPDFFFLPPMVPLPLHNPNFELGKFNNTLGPSLKIDICQLNSTQLNAQGLPIASTQCDGGPIKTFGPGSVQLVNLPLRQGGWWTLFGLPPDGFYYVLWDTRQSRLDVNKFYRIKVLIAGPPDVVLGVADVDPMSSLFQWKYTLTGEVIQLVNGFFLPIPFRVEHGGGPTLCGGTTLCASATITNLPPGSPDQFVRVQGADGSFIAGVQVPADFLPPPPGPQSVVLTISRVNTGVNNVAAGTQTIPCHANLPLQQFNSCFQFSTIPQLPLFPPENEEGRQFLKEINVAVCFVLIDQEPLDPREPYVQLWSSDAGGVNAKALPSASDAQILTAGTGRTCGNNLVGFNNNSNGFRGLASAGWQKVKGGLGRFFGVQTAYAVDLGLGGLTFGLSNIGPALTARIQRYTNTGLTLGAGATTTSTVRIVGTQKHDHSGALTTGIGGLPVTFTVAPGNGTLRLIGSELPPATQLTSITNTQPIDPESPVSGGGFAPVNWTMPTAPGTYTLTATGPATGGPITFTSTVANPVLGNPVLAFTGSDAYFVNNEYFARFNLAVTNYQAYPAEMFAPAPNLPPCGLNTNSSRTWVDIYDAINNNQIYGFCALGSPSDLQSIWFTFPIGTHPNSVYIKLVDRATGVTYVSNNVATRAPDPILTFTGTEVYSVDSSNFVRYNLAVTNYQAYPAEMFASAPYLPPCGLNTNASRTWVDIYDASNNSRIYGFCAFGSPSDLQSIWFAEPVGTPPPSQVYIKLVDRLTGVTFMSNNVVPIPPIQ